MKLLIDTGAELCLCKYSSIKEGILYNSSKILNVKGISVSVERTLGELNIRLCVAGHEIEHPFQIVGDGVDIPCDGILGKDFFEKEKAKIDYNHRQVIMGKARVKFDEDTEAKGQADTVYTVLKPRSETIVRLPTESSELMTGLISKRELVPGVIVAETLVTVREGTCLTSILNTNDREMRVSLPTVGLEDYQEATAQITVISNAESPNTEGRLRELRERVRVGHLNDVERRSIVRICEDYNDIFHLSGDKLTTTTAAEHAIPTPGIDPCRGIASRNYRIPEALKGELNQITDNMLKDKIIRHSTSPWNSPIILVKKKEDASGKQKWRLVVDFRRLNEVTVGDSYPLPLITEILDALGKARYYTTLDLANGFHQVPLREQDRSKTAFSTPNGHFEFCTMPMGICSAPATFQRLMTNVLSGLIGTKALIYLDDIVTWGATLQEHNERLTAIFDKMRVHSLRLQPDKCEFLRKEVCYIGHRITSEGVKPDEGKVTAVRDFPVPSNTK